MMVSICANRPTWGIQVAEAWSALEAGGAGSSGGERPGGWLVSELVARLVSAVEAGASSGAVEDPVNVMTD